MTTALLAMSLGTSVLGSATSAYGQYQQGQAEAEALRVAQRRNQMETAYAIEQKRKEIKRLSGQQKVMYAKAGVDLGSGSPLLVMAETARQGAEELWWIKKKGLMKESDIEKAIKGTKSASTIGAASTFLTGLGRTGLGLTYGLGETKPSGIPSAAQYVMDRGY